MVFQSYDFVMFLYKALILTSLYGFGLFSWWWWKRRHASSVFIYLTILFFGSLVENGTEAYARYLFLTGGEQSILAFKDSVYWPLRQLIYLAALLLIVGHMSYRAFFYTKVEEEDASSGDYVEEPIKTVKLPLLKVNGEILSVDIAVKKIKDKKRMLEGEKIVIVPESKE